jgi:transcriptional regulator with PAS, ATPase and Fis domain
MDVHELEALVRHQEKIMDYCFGNIFVTDAKGKIIYVNQHTVDSFKCSREAFLSMDVYEMVERKIASDSAAIFVLENKREVSMRITTNKNEDILVTARPIFDLEGQLEMVVVYSQVEDAIKELIHSLERKNSSLKRAYDLIVQYNTADHHIVANSLTMQSILETAKHVAPSDSTVILYGESGTGKEVLANFIHTSSNRSGNIFLPVNCAAIPSELMETEFFGYDKGAFTGSVQEGKTGLFETANKGTLFLDEIGELPLSMQSKLLRVLSTGDVRRVGGSKITKIDVRIIAATNRDLKNLMEKGQFREDLYYRLNVIPINIPPLRSRSEDIAGLVELFMKQLNKKYGTHKTFTKAAIECLCAYNWPGNIRELKNIIERVYIITDQDCLDSSCIEMGLGVLRANDAETHSESETIVMPDGSLKEAVDSFQRAYISQVLKACNGNIQEAAKKMGVHKSGLYKKIDKLQIENKIGI